MNPILSIVIPTKNRYFYLERLIIELTKFNSRAFEIIIQDNSADNCKFLKFLENCNDSRIKYFHQKEWLCVSDNCEAAVKKATGDYISMIGDDDAVIEQIIDFSFYMKANNIHACLPEKASYNWPGVSNKLDFPHESGVLRILDFKGSINNINCICILDEVLSKGGTVILSLPRVYHGIVSKGCLDKLRSMCGSCFPGPSPDMANAVGLCFTVQHFVVTDFPLVISGHCPKSTGGQGARHAHHGELSAQSFLPENTAETWPVDVPKFWSGPTIYAASVISALTACKKTILLKQFDFQFLYASCFVFHFEYILRTLRLTNSFRLFDHLRVLGSVLIILIFRLKFLFKNIKSRLKLNYQKDYRITDVEGIGNAIAIVSKRVKIFDLFL